MTWKNLIFFYVITKRVVYCRSEQLVVTVDCFCNEDFELKMHHRSLYTLQPAAHVTMSIFNVLFTYSLDCKYSAFKIERYHAKLFDTKSSQTNSVDQTKEAQGQ